MRDNISPEEKLLRLIRGQKKQSTAIDKTSQDAAQGLKAGKSRVLNFSFQKYLVFLNINKIIFTIFVISCIYLIFSFAYPIFMPKNIILPEITQEKITEEETGIAQRIKPYEFYAQSLKNRQIFSSASGQDSEKPKGALNADLTKDFSLIGIISGENPQAVIEDKKTEKSYYVTKGQFIGEFKVEEIQEGKIILNYNGQKFELYL
jgi:type II secretory pathway component PulC